MCAAGLAIAGVVFKSASGKVKESLFLEDTQHPTFINVGEGVELRIYPDSYNNAYKAPLDTLVIDLLTPTGKAIRADTPYPGIRLDYSGAQSASIVDKYYRTGFRSADEGIELIGIPPPGTYGSKGDISWADDERTVEMVNTAIDRIVTELQPKKIVVSGHSSTGKIAAGLMTYRTDIDCLVVSHAYFDNNESLARFGWKQSPTGNPKPYNFAANLSNFLDDDKRIVHILSSEADKIVPHEQSMKLRDALVELEQDVRLLNLNYEGLPDHGSTSYALKYAVACARALVK